MDQVNRLLLPIGLPIVLVLGIAWPSPGSSVGAWSVGPLTFSDAAVVLIFFINGLQMRFAGAREPALLRAIAWVLGINLLLAPAIGVAAVRLLDLPLGLAVGIALMASVPTTLSSAAVIAINAGGDRLWALTLTIVTVLVGSITAPLAVSAILSAAVSLSPWPLLQQVALIVLLPTAVGALARRTIVRRVPEWFGLIPSLAVISVVWTTMSLQSDAASELSAGILAAMVLIAVVGHGSLLLAAGLPASRMTTAHAMPVVFVASQKTLPLALTILVILVGEVPQIAAAAAAATITCVVWHFVQVFGDSVLANRLALWHGVRAQRAG